VAIANGTAAALASPREQLGRSEELDPNPTRCVMTALLFAVAYTLIAYGKAGW